MREALARLAESAIGFLRTRGELAGVEFAEERERLLVRLALLLGGIVILAFAVLFAGMFVIAVFWDTHRLGAIACVALFFALGGALMVARAKTIGNQGPAPFSATLAELERDRARFARAVDEPSEEP
jgi:uncharacterized membrane protein YqjE